MAGKPSPQDPIYRTIAVALAHIEGGNAFGAGTPRAGNPYRPNDLRWQPWFAGWDDRARNPYCSRAAWLLPIGGALRAPRPAVAGLG